MSRSTEAYHGFRSESLDPLLIFWITRTLLYNADSAPFLNKGRDRSPKVNGICLDHRLQVIPECSWEPETV